jgi:hypothetical protein
MRDAAVIEDPRIEPFADQSEKDSVSYPALEKIPEMAVVDRIKELSNIHVQDPAASHGHRLVPEGIQGLVRRTARAEAIRAVQEVLLVDRFQDHDHRPLKNLVFEGRYPQRSGLGSRASLGDMNSSHGRRHVGAGLGSVQQRLKVAHQVRRIVLAGLSVNSGRAVLPGLLVRLMQPVDVDEIGQGCEPHLGTLPSEFRDPLSFRGHVHGFRGTRHVSLQRCHDTASPSLPGVHRDRSPGSSVLWDAPNPRRPSRTASLPSRADTIVSPVFRSPRPGASHRGPGSLVSGLPIRNCDGDVGASQVPGEPWWPLSVFFDPGGIRRVLWDQVQQHLTRPPLMSTTKAPSVLSFRGSFTRPLTWLSTLRRVGRPTTTQDSLLAAGPALPGGIGYPQGSGERFPSSRLFLLSTGFGLGARTFLNHLDD